MATIRKRGTKWQVQIRRTGQRSLSNSFCQRRDAESWARQMEVKADRRELPDDPKLLEGYTLGQLVQRYRDTVSIRKRGGDYERILLKAFLRHPICSRRLSELSTEDFAAYRDDRLQDIKPAPLKRQLTPIHNLFEIARDEWGLPIVENPLDRLKLHAPDNRRERRLRSGEFERLIEAARSCQNPYIIPIIHLAVETGMRRGEIISMCWDHLDLGLRLNQTQNAMIVARATADRKFAASLS
ncbi:hypothetical protein BMS3Bbin10_01495 [bacterium BMS3Bbin10]|nr:hypothetical protein BMS3Bbin10_01495 [bacterium BMS3Bbin10]